MRGERAVADEPAEATFGREGRAEPEDAGGSVVFGQDDSVGAVIADPDRAQCGRVAG